MAMDNSRIINIAFVIDKIETSMAGTESQLLMLAEALNKKQFSVTIICLYDSQWLRDNQLPFRVEAISTGRLGDKNILWMIIQYLRLIKKYRIDILHAYYFKSIILSAIVSLLGDIPILIGSRRGFINSEKSRKARSMLLRLVSRRYNLTICNSKALANFVMHSEKISNNNICVIYNGYDFNKIASVNLARGKTILQSRGIGENNIIICMVANLRPVKNIALFIKAANLLSNEYQLLRFVVIGEGPERARLEKMILEYNLKDKFHLIGSITRPGDVMANCHIAALTSSSESLSNALLEYSALGLPVVALDVGGNREIIYNNKSGFLIEKNNVGQLLEKLSILINDIGLRRQMGIQGSSRVKEVFSREMCIDAYENCYRKYFNK